MWKPSIGTIAACFWIWFYFLHNSVAMEDFPTAGGPAMAIKQRLWGGHKCF